MSDTVTRVKEYREFFRELRSEQSDHLPRWKELAQYFLPRRGRYLDGATKAQNNDGRKKHGKVINGSGIFAIRTLAAGLQSGLTSPSRPWFNLTLADDDLAEYQPVRNWLHMLRNGMLTVLARSNYYTSHHYIFSELGVFGTACMLIDKDREDYNRAIRCRPFTIGEYCLALDSQYKPAGLYRQFEMRASQILAAFGKGNPDGLPREVLNAIRSKRMNQKFEVGHVIEKSTQVDLKRDDWRGMPYRAVYFMMDGDADKILEEGGYHCCPFVAPRWDVSGIDTYGGGCGDDGIGDNKMLQKMEEKKLKGLDKQMDPPMKGPTSLRNEGGSTIPGGMTWVDETQTQKFEPSQLINPDIQKIAFEIDRVEQRIGRSCYNDLWLGISQIDRSGVSAEEIIRKHEEKLIMIGPVVERLLDEDLDPTVERVFDLMVQANALPPIPKELPAGMPIKVEFISMLAQAQKRLGNTAIERVIGFVGNVAKVYPPILDKIDFEEAVDQYATGEGAPPKIIRSDEGMNELRNERQKQQAAAMMAQNMKPAADSLKQLATSPIGNNGQSVLDRMVPQ